MECSRWGVEMVHSKQAKTNRSGLPLVTKQLVEDSYPDLTACIFTLLLHTIPKVYGMYEPL